VRGLLAVLSVYSQPPSLQKFTIPIGSLFEKSPSGTIWLYNHSGFGLQKDRKIQLAAIRPWRMPVNRSAIETELEA
jgi:hypothetical protein